MNPLRWLCRVLLSDDDTPLKPDQLIVVYETLDEGEAAITADILRRQDIRVMQIEKGRVPWYGWIERPIQLYVRYADLAHAREVLGYDIEQESNVGHTD